MDPVTHALSGMVIKQIGFKRNAALIVLMISAVAPDLDYITRFWGADIFLEYHRGITHGILALCVFPLIMGLIFKSRGGFLYCWFLSFLGYASHLALDLTNQYGTMILSPLDWNRYSLDLTFIIDPYISIALLLAVVMGRVGKKRSAAIAVITILLIAAYLGGRSYFQAQARHFLKTRMDANVYRTYPLPNGLLRWWFVTKTADEINTGFVDLFMQKVFIYEKLRPNGIDAAVIDSKGTRLVKNFMSIAHNPYAEVKRENNRIIVKWRELSVSFLPGERFVAEVMMDGNGNVISSEFKF